MGVTMAGPVTAASGEPVLRLNTWSLWCVVVGVFGQVGYLADVLQPLLPAWVAVLLFIVPVAAVVFVQPG